MNIAEFFDKMDKSIPLTIVAICWLILLPIRVLVLLFLPANARYSDHKLHKIRDFFEFDFNIFI